MTKKFKTMSKRITDQDGEVATLPKEFFEKAERGMPHPSDAVRSLDAMSKATTSKAPTSKTKSGDKTNPVKDNSKKMVSL